jgi:hypothetical protein
MYFQFCTPVRSISKVTEYKWRNIIVWLLRADDHRFVAVLVFHITLIFIPIYITFILLIQLFLLYAFLYSLMISYRLYFHLLLKNITFHFLFSWHHTLPNAALLHYSFIYQISYTIPIFREVKSTYCVQHSHYTHVTISTENSFGITHLAICGIWSSITSLRSRQKTVWWLYSSTVHNSML